MGLAFVVGTFGFNYQITIDVERIRRTPSSEWSTLRHAIGRIDYRDGESGVLIYLKASMTGHEDTAVLQYKSSRPTFPHESTGDQFYREDQFESYRRLGQQIAAEVPGRARARSGSRYADRPVSAGEVTRDLVRPPSA